MPKSGAPPAARRSLPIGNETGNGKPLQVIAANVRQIEAGERIAVTAHGRACSRYRTADAQR